MNPANRRIEQKRKSKTTGDRVEGTVPDVEFLIVQPYSKRNRSKTLSSRKPIPNPEAFTLTEKKRNKPEGENNYLKAPNTPMKRSQSDEERTQKERYDAEISYRFTTKIEIAHTKTSVVFRVTDSNTNLYVIKELNPAFLSKKKKLQKAALLEFKHAKLLRNHPNIVRYDTYWHYGPFICFQMEYLPGGSLDRFLQENPLHDPHTKCEREILWYFLLDLLNGIAYMHKKKIVHLDIKPSNIFVCQRPNGGVPILKIGDFGLSRCLGTETSNERFKKGDGKYLAPELLDTRGQITTAVDIFSLGISLYEMATDYSASDALWNDVCQNKVSYEKVSKPLMVLLARMMCKEPSYRISAENCLLTNEKLQKIAKEVGVELFQYESSIEEMEDVSSAESECGQENEEDNANDEGKKSLDAIRKKLF